jgi:hypothetical protein
VVFVDDWVKKLAELLVGRVGSCVDTDTGVDILAATENANLEGDSLVIALVLVFIPNFLGQVLGDKGSASLWEAWEVNQIVN